MKGNVGAEASVQHNNCAKKDRIAIQGRIEEKPVGLIIGMGCVVQTV